MRKELTADKKDWISWKNDLFQPGDILILHERAVVESNPEFPDRKDVGKVLAEPGDELVVMGADCIGCFVQNRSRPELNYVPPPHCPKGEEHLYDRWHCYAVQATLVREGGLT